MNITKAWTAALDDYVIDLAWSPDGRRLAAASAAGPIVLLDGAVGSLRNKLSGHADGTNALAWAPAARNSEVSSQWPEIKSQMSDAVLPIAALRPRSSDLLASGGQDGCVRFWSAATGTSAAEGELGPGAWVECLAWRPVANASAPTAGSQPPIDTSQSPTPHFQLPSHVLAAAAGRKLALLGPDGAVRHAFPDAPKTISAFAWHPGGGCIAVAWYGGVCLWDADDFHVQREYAYGGGIPILVWSPDGRWLVAGAQDKAVHLWIPEEEEEFHMSGYETKVRELSFSADSRWLATGGARDTCVWDCSGAGPEGREPQPLPHNDRVCALAYQHAGGLLATAANDCEVNFWDPTRHSPRLATARLTAPASKLAWSPDDSRLAIGSQQGGVLVLRVEP